MVAIIVAVDNNWGIGFEGKLLANIPEDKKYFRKITENSIVLMGRRTWDSLPIKPLPNRINYIISRSKNSANKTSHIITLEDAINIIKSVTKKEKIFIIGGGEIYRALLPYCDIAYVTKIHGNYKADTFFPNLDNLEDEWKVDKIVEADAEKYPVLNIPYRFVTYKKIKIGE